MKHGTGSLSFVFHAPFGNDKLPTMLMWRLDVNIEQKDSKLTWIVWGVVLVTAVFLLSACGQAPPNQAAQEGEVVTAFIGDLSASASASGKVLPQREATLSLETAGRVETIYVQSGSAVEAGEVLVQLETADLNFAVASAAQALAIQEANLAELKAPATEAEIQAAEAQVASAQAQLQRLQEGPRPEEVAATEANVRAAAANIQSSAERLDQAQAGPGESEIASARVNLAQAEAQQKNVELAWDQAQTDEARADLTVANEALAAAQAQLNALLEGADPNAVEAAQANLAAAVAQRDAAQAQLDQLQNGSTDAQIAAAEAQVAQAQANLDSLRTGPTDEEIEIAEAQVEQARLSLSEAEEALAKASLEVPFDGVVTEVLVAEGEFASGPAVEMIDMDSLEVVLSVDEIDIGNLEIGQPATVTLETWPDEEIESEVRAIAPSPDTGPNASSALISYEVRLSLGQTDLPVRSGMTANAQLLTAQREDVLLVPNRAITADRQTGRFYVNLVRGEEIEEVEVTIGLRDNQYTQITSGLAEGDQLQIGGLESPFENGPPFGGGN